MPFDGTAFVSSPTAPIAPEATPHGLWQRTRSAWSRLLHPARLRAFEVPLPTAPTRESTQALQTLVLARSLIADEQAWVQRRYETRDGRRCAVGALRGAARLMHDAVPHGEAVSSLLAVAMSRGFTDIETMNDHSTHTQVVGAFDEAIRRVGHG
ncbi:MAG: hypothetical protein BGO51_00815 [Rhodospirillales bacterium 69-11]|jgi:hypothetical protein|nr:hypothetical protein [Rhodospirillales bacterium]OJW25554.1 MAG: hypothetical protein BGO51_00815 [Rhodospirillales bacterium 69-11]